MADQASAPPGVRPAFIDPQEDSITMTQAEYLALPKSDAQIPDDCHLCRPRDGADGKEGLFDPPVAYARMPRGSVYLGRILADDVWRLVIVKMGGKSPSDVG